MSITKRKIQTRIIKGVKSLLVLFVAFTMITGAQVPVHADTATKTVTSQNAKIRVKANAQGQGYQIEVKNTSGAYLQQHYGAAISGDEASSNSNGSVVYFKYNGHEYLVGNKYYFSALTEAADTTSTVFDFTDNAVSGSTISTTYNARVPVYGGGIITVKLVQKLTVTDTHVKKDFDVTFNTNVVDMRLLHGGDTFFGGKDAGFPSYNPLNNSVYIVPLLSGTDKDLGAGIMQFSGDTETPADNYYAGRYSDGRAEMLKGQLSNHSIPITSTTSVDGGYYLQWNRGSGSSMSVRSTERFIAESGAVQILAPSAINAIFGSQYSADFTAFNIGSSAVVITLKATSPAATTKIYDGNLEVSSITLQANQTKDISVRGIAGNTASTGVIKLVATYSYGGTSNTYTAQTDFITKDGPSIRNVTINTQQKDSLNYSVETNRTDVPVTVKMFDGATGTLVSGWKDDFTPTVLTTTRTASIASLTPGKTYYLQVMIEGNLTPNRASTFIQWSDAAPTGFGTVPTKGPNLNDGKITNVTSDMEYRKSGSDNYTRITGTEITGLTAGEYAVRYRDTTGETNGWHLQSADTSVIVKDTTFNVTQGTIANGTWSGSNTVAITDTKSGTLTFIPTSGYELKAVDVIFTGSGTVSVDNLANTITISNVKSAGTINAVCSQTEESINRAIVNTEVAKLKSDITLDALQAINTDLYTKIYESGKSKNTDVIYTFKNTTYTNDHLVSALNNTATDQTVVLEITLTKGTVSQTKNITITFPKENIAPVVTSIKTKVLNDGIVSTILNNLTFGAFYNKEIEVTIDGQDDNSGIKSISYQLVTSDNPGTAVPAPDKAWVTINENPAIFSIAPSFKGVIFTKAEDKAGNISINSYSKKGAVITENGLPIITYDNQLTPTENTMFVNTTKNLTTILEDSGTTSNLKSTQYKVFTKDGSAWQEITAKTETDTYQFDDNKTKVTYNTLLDASGRYKVTATGEDFAGNIPISSDGYINIDVDNPTLDITSTAPTTWVNQHTITMNLTDNSSITNSGLYQLSVSKDGEVAEVLKTYADNSYLENGYAYEIDSEGVHTYTFKVTDKAGNTVSSSNYTVLFDKTVPLFPRIIKEDTNGNTDEGITWYKGVKPNITLIPTAAELNRSDNISNYRLNDGIKEVFNAPTNISSLLLEGKNTVQVSVYDKAGNISTDGTNAYLEEIVYVDTQSASIDKITLNGAEIDDMAVEYRNSDSEIKILSSDQTSGVSHIAYALCKGLDTVPEQSDWVEQDVVQDGSISLLIEEEGEYSLFVKAYDKAGNDASAPVMVKVVVDKTKPVIEGIEDEKVYYTDQVFDIEELNISKVEINGIEVQDDVIQASQEEEQIHIIKVTDKAGNMEEYKIYTKPIDSLLLPLVAVTENNVNKSHQSVCEEIEKQLLEIDQTNASKEQIEIIENNINKVTILLSKIKEVQQEIKDIVSNVVTKPIKEVSIKDENTLIDNELKIDDLLKQTNLEDAERKQLEAQKENIMQMKDHILTLRTLSTQKSNFDQQETINEEELVQFEETIKNTMNISAKVDNTSIEQINVKYLLSILTPEDILHYEGQNIEISLLAKEVNAPYASVLEGYQRVKSYDFTVYKKIDDKEEQMYQLVVPIEITIDFDKEKDTEYVMLRHHQGETEKLSDLSTKTNQVVVKTTKFSTYELLKQDTSVNPPTIPTSPTGDNTEIALWIAGSLVSVACVAIIIVLKHKRKDD